MQSIGYYIHKVNTLPPDAIFRKLFRKTNVKVKTKVNRYRAKTLGTKLSDEDLFKAVEHEELRIRSLSDFIDHFRKRREPKFFINHAQKHEILKIIQKDFPDLIEKIITDADQICEHIFDLLGSGHTSVASKMNRIKKIEIEDNFESFNPMDWHIDFKTGYRWDSKTYFEDIEIPYGKGDIKIPWELSRFQHIPTLGKAYGICQKLRTENKQKNPAKYASEFMNQIEHWIDNNPVEFGVNWTCPMDVAIRAVNWIFGFYFFINAKEIPDKFWIKFLRILFLHGRFIRRNLEIGYDDRDKRITSNHYLSDIVGLIFLGIFFKDAQEGKAWLNFGVKELIGEMEFQIHPDGTDFESSIPYHRLVLELFVTSAILCQLNGIELSQKFWERLEKMFGFVMYYTKPDGGAPQIGDNDSGRVWI